MQPSTNNPNRRFAAAPAGPAPILSNASESLGLGILTIPYLRNISAFVVPNNPPLSAHYLPPMPPYPCPAFSPRIAETPVQYGFVRPS